MTAGGHDAGGELERLLDADAVDDERRPAPAGGAARLARGQAVGRERDVRAVARGELERLLAPVDGDDATRRERPEDLDGDVTRARPRR